MGREIVERHGKAFALSIYRRIAAREKLPYGAKSSPSYGSKHLEAATCLLIIDATEGVSRLSIDAGYAHESGAPMTSS